MTSSLHTNSHVHSPYSFSAYSSIEQMVDASRLIHFVAPFVCAKKRVDDDKIAQYLLRESFIRSDDMTFFVEDSSQSSDNDFNRRAQLITDKDILFTACTVTRDFSCHFISVALLDDIMIATQSWGGCNFTNLTSNLIQSDKCFVVHKYHDIISSNRISSREGPVEGWFIS